MADGSSQENTSDVSEIEIDQEQTKSVPIAFLHWLFNTSSGFLTIWATLTFMTLVGVMVFHIFSSPIISPGTPRTLFLSSTTLFWLPLLLLLMDSPENLASGPKLRLPLVSLFILIIMTAFAVFDSILGWNYLGSKEINEPNIYANRIAFVSFTALAFIPLLCNATRTAIHEHSNRKNNTHSNNKLKKESHDKDTEAISALVATLVVLGVGSLAFFAGDLGADLKFPNSFGLILCGLVIGIFAIVVFLETLAEMPPIKFMAQVLQKLAKITRPLATFYDFIDASLARVGAGIVGMNHRNGVSRYFILSGILTCFSIMGWWLPAPLGLLPVSIAFVLALSVSRLWSWVEEDRALAAMTEHKENAPYRVGFREDFRDETLLGFIFVFALVPIAMMQAHDGEVFGKELFQNADGKGFLSWFGYFGVELAKAVPIVDWAEIYNVYPGDDLIKMNEAPSRHAVFLARVMVDLVLIASLLQALAISTRNRQQKRLYRAKYINRLDRFVERTEMQRAIFHTLKKEHADTAHTALEPWDAIKCFDLKKLNDLNFVDFRVYDENRLRRIFGLDKNYDSGKNQLTLNFIRAISHQGNIPLANAIDLVIEIAEGEKNELDMFAAYQRAIHEHEENTNRMTLGDIYRILTALRHTSGLRDFKYNLMEKLVAIGPKEEVIDILSGIQNGNDKDRFVYTRKKAESLLQSISSNNYEEKLFS